MKKINQSTTMFVLFISGLIIMMNLYLTIPLLENVHQLFQVTLSKASLLSSLYSLGFASGCLFYGVLSEKYGRKNVMLIGAIALTMITFLIGCSASINLIIGLRFLQGLAAASFSPVALAFSGEYFEGVRKTTAIGLISTGFLMAGILGQVLASSVSELTSFQGVFIVMGCLMTGVTIGLFFFLPKTDSNQPDLVIRHSFLKITKVISNKSLILCYLIAFFLLMTFVLMYSLFIQKLTLFPYELDASELLQIRLFGLIGMIASPFAGRITQKISTSQLLTLALSLTGISSLFMSVLTSLTLLTIVSVLFVLGIALAIPSLVSLVNQFGASERGLSVSVYTFILFLGTSTAPLVATVLGAYAQTSLAFLLLTGITFIPIVISLFIKQKMK